MNALANSQENELAKFLKLGYPQGKPPVTFRRYTGQESEEQREEIRDNPPDILLTNYVMLEYLLTRPVDERRHPGRAGTSVPGARRAAHLPRPAGRRRRPARPPRARALPGDEPALRRHLGHDGGPGHVRRAAGRGRARRQPAVRHHGRAEQRHRRDAAPRDGRRRPRRPGVSRLRCTSAFATAAPPGELRRVVADPLARWIERTLGITWDAADERYRRCVAAAAAGRGRRRAAAQRADRRATRALHRGAARTRSCAAARRATTPASRSSPSACISSSAAATPLAASLDAASRRGTSRPAASSSCPGSGRDRVCCRSRSAASAARTTSPSAATRPTRARCSSRARSPTA